MNFLDLFQKNSATLPADWRPDRHFIDYRYSTPTKPSYEEIPSPSDDISQKPTFDVEVVANKLLQFTKKVD